MYVRGIFTHCITAFLLEVTHTLSSTICHKSKEALQHSHPSARNRFSPKFESLAIDLWQGDSTIISVIIIVIMILVVITFAYRDID